MINLDSWKECKKLDNDKIELYTLDNFLTNEECNKLIEISKRNLVDSTMSLGGCQRPGGCMRITPEMIENSNLDYSGGTRLIAPVDGIYIPDDTKEKINVTQGYRATVPGIFCPPKTQYKTSWRTSQTCFRVC